MILYLSEFYSFIIYLFIYLFIYLLYYLFNLLIYFTDLSDIYQKYIYQKSIRLYF